MGDINLPKVINELIENGIIKIVKLEPLSFALTDKGVKVAENLFGKVDKKP